MARRNLTDAEFTYYIGKMYESKKKCKEDNLIQNQEPNPQNEESDKKTTAQKIAEQFKVSPKTVERAEQFSKAIDTLEENVGGYHLLRRLLTTKCIYLFGLQTAFSPYHAAQATASTKSSWIDSRQAS